MASAMSALLGAEPWVAPELSKPWERPRLQTLGGREGAQVEVGDAAQAMLVFPPTGFFITFQILSTNFSERNLNCRLHNSLEV